jgi:hypothetical protein
MTKFEARRSWNLRPFRASVFVIPSSFGFRHSSFPVQPGPPRSPKSDGGGCYTPLSQTTIKARIPRRSIHRSVFLRVQCAFARGFSSCSQLWDSLLDVPSPSPVPPFCDHHPQNYQASFPTNRSQGWSVLGCVRGAKRLGFPQHGRLSVFFGELPGEVDRLLRRSRPAARYTNWPSWHAARPLSYSIERQKRMELTR